MIQDAMQTTLAIARVAVSWAYLAVKNADVLVLVDMHILDENARSTWQCCAEPPYHPHHYFLQSDRAKSSMAFPCQGTRASRGETKGRRAKRLPARSPSALTASGSSRADRKLSSPKITTPKPEPAQVGQSEWFSTTTTTHHHTPPTHNGALKEDHRRRQSRLLLALSTRRRPDPARHQGPRAQDPVRRRDQICHRQEGEPARRRRQRRCQ